MIETFENYNVTIINYFEQRLTNASAESFNAKIKAFRSQFRGVGDIGSSWIDSLSYTPEAAPHPPEKSADPKLMQSQIKKALYQNLFIHKYIIALNHAFLWIAALSLAGFFHVSPWFEHKEALLFSTLVAYSAYLCESGLGTWRVATSQTEYFINFRKASLWKFVWLNFFTNAGFAILFLIYPTWYLMLAVIFTAGWQKYMDGRIPPRLQSTMIPVSGQTFKAIEL